MSSVILNNKKGYSKHPETLQWKGHTKAMVVRHNEIEREMTLRGFKPKSPMGCVDGDSEVFPDTIEPLEVMERKLRGKQE